MKLGINEIKVIFKKNRLCVFNLITTNVSKNRSYKYIYKSYKPVPRVVPVIDDVDGPATTVVVVAFPPFDETTTLCLRSMLMGDSGGGLLEEFRQYFPR